MPGVGIVIEMGSGAGGGSIASVDGFIPTQFTGVDVWLPPGSVLLNAGDVETWIDRSGLAHNVTQATGTKRPDYNATGSPKGSQVVIGDAVDDFLRGTWTAPQPLDFWIVAKFGSASVGATLCDGSSGNTHRLFLASTTSVTATADGVSNLSRTTTDVTVNYHCYHVVFNGASSSFQIDDETAIAGTFAGTAAGGLILNIFGDQASAPGGASILEVVRFSRVLNATETAAMRNYLRTSHGV